MAKRKSRFSKFLGALTGTPYDKLLKQIEKIPDELDDDRALSKEIRRFVKIIVKAHKEEKIDDDEHDLLIEELEDIDPEGRTFDKISEDEEYYTGDGVPDTPNVKVSKNVDLDSLMRKKTNQFTGSFGREEFDEYREKMALEFAEESRSAVEEGYVERTSNVDPTGRVFRDDEEEALETKRRIAVESGLINENEELEDDENYSVDEDGVEWYQDEDGQWWYREPDEDDWVAAEE
ncbi:MAG: hypothetical protein CMB48_03805 [Euryarchaeota archaeon]|nr:hypothetical protein [Euryarchaeota archaeon]|tara:strand:- start:1766 stop:2467 length:702 start_codon:yes stop_codon:yes gene_type:complete